MIQSKRQKLSNLLSKLPNELSSALEKEYQSLSEAYLLREWKGVQNSAGRFGEAVLRVLEYHNSGTYTPIDGVSKPNRKTVVGRAKNNTSLAPAFRFQIPLMVELVLDFRNNRNAAHLGKIKPWHLDAATVTQIASWIIAELIRLESKVVDSEVQGVIDKLAELPSPLIQRVANTPLVLDTSLRAEEKVLVLLLDAATPVNKKVLFSWSEYGNSSRWTKQVLGGLVRKKMIYIDENDQVHLLRPGETIAKDFIKKND